MITRRRLVVTAVGALCFPFTSFAQRIRAMPRIGVLGAGSAAGWAPMVDALRIGLHELGYTDGKSIAIDYRWGDGNYVRLRGLAAELTALNPDVIVSHASAGVGAAKQATSSVPIVMASIGDPVASGFVSNLSRPGGNITGLAFLSSEIAAKRLQVIKEIMPKVAHVALLFDDSAQRNLRPVLQNAASGMNVTVDFVAITSADQLDVIFGRMSREGVGAVMVQETPLLISKAKAIGATASRHRIASIGFREVAEGGGLLAYGANIPDMWRRSATYVDKILKGAKPADMPIEQATKFELVINLKAAKALGITVPQSLLVSADKVIE